MSDSPHFFISREAAERYARGRPELHAEVIAKVSEVTGVSRFKTVLDVGCGTGQSTSAVAAIADRVTGIDNSAAMLALAVPQSGIEFRRADAEQLPFADNFFDLITAGLAFHWFDRERFLAEARRVLKPAGWLVIYNIAFLGEMDGNPAFAAWYRGEYLSRFPSPPRSPATVTDDVIQRFHFKTHARSQMLPLARMTCNQFVNYVLSQSNVIAAIEQGSHGWDDVYAWIAPQIEPFFRSVTQTLQFRAEIALFRATDQGNSSGSS